MMMEPLVVYVDGSFFEEGEFAGSGIYFGPDHGLNLEQYLPEEYTDRSTKCTSAIRAEIYASVLAIRQAYEHNIQTSLIIKQDCKEAIHMLKQIDPSQPLPTSLVKDPLLSAWWTARQYISVKFEWVKAHETTFTFATEQDWHGNYMADKMAKRAANMTRYEDARRIMDAQNPLKRPFVLNKRLPLLDSYLIKIPSCCILSKKLHENSLQDEEVQEQIKVLTRALETVGKEEAEETDKLVTSLTTILATCRPLALRYKMIESLPACVLTKICRCKTSRQILTSCQDPCRPLFANLQG